MIRLNLNLLIALVLITAPLSTRAQDKLILIASSDSVIETIDSLDLRKLYFGFVVSTKNGQSIRPLINASDDRIREIFLQDVMGMSARSYDRRLLARALQTGRSRPDELRATGEVIDRVAGDPLAVSFVWEEDIQYRDDIKILSVIWRK